METQPQQAVRSNAIRVMTIWNYLLGALVLLVAVLLMYQLWFSTQIPEPNTTTPIVVSLEGDGVVPQRFDLNLKEVNAQQTVVLTELNTKSGAPIAVKISTDTVDQGVNHVITND